MNKSIKFNLVICLIVLIFFSFTKLKGQASASNNQDYQISFKYSGKLQAESDSIFLAAVTDIKTDSSNNIYICDAKDHCIKVFNSDGQFKFQFGSKGKGPGELLNPKTIAISNTKIYVADSNNRINEFQLDGNFIRNIRVDFGGDDICVNSNDDFIYCTPYPPIRHYSEKIQLPCLYIFTTKTEKWQLVNALSFIGKTKNGYLAASSAFVAVTSNKNLIYATSFPYEIRIYGFDGNLIKTITDKNMSIDPAQKVEISPNVEIFIPTTQIRSVLTMPNGYFMVSVVDFGKSYIEVYKSRKRYDSSQAVVWCDLYNSEGEYLKRIKIENPLEMGVPLYCDQKNRVYTFSPEWELPNVKIYYMTFNL